MRILATLAALTLAAPLPAAERPVDAAKSQIGFSVTEMGVSVKGQFKRFTAKIDLDPAKLDRATAQVTVDIDSIDSGSDEGDETARDPAWLDALHFPQATFKSSAVRALGEDRYEARGTLSIRGSAREVAVPFTLKPQADGSAVATGGFKIRRTDFGIGGGKWNEGDLVADEVPVQFRLVLGAPR